MEQPVVLIQPSHRLFHLDLWALWQYRDLLYFLAWRDVRVRYKQTVIGAAWAILQPLATMAIFTAVFSILARMPSDGLPYPVFALAGLLPWQLFAQALSSSTTSLVGDGNLIRKVYFPRLVIPVAAIGRPVVDFALSFVVLLGLMAWFRVAPSWRVLIIPWLVALAALTALAVGLWLSALNLRYRDVGHLIPFLVQTWMFASPVVYPATLVPERWRLLYILNPMAAVIEGFRWALLGRGTVELPLIWISIISVAVLLLGGLLFFRRMERTFADVV